VKTTENHGKLWKTYGKYHGKLWKTYGKYHGKLWKIGKLKEL
jgi:hypothetical protein